MHSLNVVDTNANVVLAFWIFLRVLESYLLQISKYCLTGSLEIKRIIVDLFENA